MQKANRRASSLDTCRIRPRRSSNCRSYIFLLPSIFVFVRIRMLNPNLKSEIDAYNPTGSTMTVRFNSSKTDRWETSANLCHINWAVLDSSWEREFCRVPFVTGRAIIANFARHSGNNDHAATAQQKHVILLITPRDGNVPARFVGVPGEVDVATLWRSDTTLRFLERRCNRVSRNLQSALLGDRRER